MIGAVGHLFFPLCIVILSVVTTAVFSTRQASHRFASKFIEVKLCSPYEVRTFRSTLHHECITGSSRFVIIIARSRSCDDRISGVSGPTHDAVVIDGSDISIRRFKGDGINDIVSVKCDLIDSEVVSIVVLIRCLDISQLLLYFFEREHTHGRFRIVVLIAGEDKCSAYFARFHIPIAHIIMAASEDLVVVSYLHDIRPVKLPLYKEVVSPLCICSGGIIVVRQFRGCSTAVMDYHVSIVSASIGPCSLVASSHPKVGDVDFVSERLVLHLVGFYSIDVIRFSRLHIEEEGCCLVFCRHIRLSQYGSVLSGSSNVFAISMDRESHLDGSVKFGDQFEVMSGSRHSICEGSGVSLHHICIENPVEPIRRDNERIIGSMVCGIDGLPRSCSGIVAEFCTCERHRLSFGPYP